MAHWKIQKRALCRQDKKKTPTNEMCIMNSWRRRGNEIYNIWKYISRYRTIALKKVETVKRRETKRPNQKSTHIPPTAMKIILYIFSFEVLLVGCCCWSCIADNFICIFHLLRCFIYAFCMCVCVCGVGGPSSIYVYHINNSSTIEYMIYRIWSRVADI